jgi:hypothetical protein
VSVSALLLLLVAQAQAQDAAGYVALLDQAKAAIAAGDYKSARQLLAQADTAAAGSDALILERDLARLPFYLGLVEWRAGDKDTAALNHWRDAITLSTSFVPEADVLPESDGQDVYYALMGEVKARESVTLGLPEDPVDTVIFVDGRRMEPFDAVLVGRHFIQLRCPEGNVAGSWYTFGAPPPDYLVLCSGGSYPVAKGSGKAPKDKGPSKAELARAEKEAAKREAAEKAAAEKAAKEAAAAEKAAADKAAAEKAAADKAAADKAAADKAAADKAAADKAAADKAAADKAAADKASADKAAADKASADKAAADKAAADKAAADKAAADKGAADKAAADKAAADKVAADKAAADKAAADKAAADKAAADKAAADKAAADKAAADKAAADKAAAGKDGSSTARVDKGGGSGALGWAMIAGGGAMLAGGGVVNFLVVNPAYAEAQDANDDPRTYTRAEADAIVGRFNTGRYATIGLLAAGVATAGVGVFLGPLDTQLFFTPNGLGVGGRW